MKTVVIGSGFGGIAAALRMRANGHDVTLLEKHDDLGGRARVFERNGFKFDGGPTVITAPYLIYELFSGVGFCNQLFSLETATGDAANLFFVVIIAVLLPNGI